MPGASPARGTVSSIKMRSAATARCLTRGESGSVTTSEKQTREACRISSFSVADFRARVIPNKIRIPKPSRESLQRKDFCIKTSG